MYACWFKKCYLPESPIYLTQPAIHRAVSVWVREARQYEGRSGRVNPPRHIMGQLFLQVTYAGPREKVPWPERGDPTPDTLYLPRLINVSPRHIHNHRFYLFTRLEAAVFGALGLVYGSIYMAVWGNAFVTDIERWLWRGSSVALIGTPCLYACVMFVTSINYDSIKKRKRLFKLLYYLWTYYAVVLVVPRLIILFLALYSLRWSPPATYQVVNWSAYLPHFGG